VTLAGEGEVSVAGLASSASPIALRVAGVTPPTARRSRSPRATPRSSPRPAH
jgi:hypothetical protein